MLDLNGAPPTAGSMGTQIFCTDCHNSDDNREFGGSGPNGPHGSKYWHILGTRLRVQPGARRSGYVDHGQSASAARSQRERTLWHVRQVSQPERRDAEHVLGIPQQSCGTDGFSCSTCHNPHGMTATSANPTGARMVDFDMNVVGQNAGFPISYDPGSNTCVLQCHNTAHDPGGSIRKLTGPQQGTRRNQGKSKLTISRSAMSTRSIASFHYRAMSRAHQWFDSTPLRVVAAVATLTVAAAYRSDPPACSNGQRYLVASAHRVCGSCKITRSHARGSSRSQHPCTGLMPVGDLTCLAGTVYRLFSLAGTSRSADDACKWQLRSHCSGWRERRQAASGWRCS